MTDINEVAKLMEADMTREQAKNLGATKWWIGADKTEVFLLQVRQEKMCMDFGDFQECANVALGRPVFTTEFTQPDRLISELGRKLKKTSQ